MLLASLRKEPDRAAATGFVISLAIGCGKVGDEPDGPGRLESSGGMELVLVPAGEFLMGSRDAGMHREQELPRHRVVVTRPFYIGVTEVTVGQFAEFVEATDYRTEAERDPQGGFGFDLGTGSPLQTGGLSWRDPGFEQTNEHPVVQVSWIDAEAFCQWLSERDDRRYRLPTEAEWEYAARAGTTTRWFFGEDPSELSEFANIADASLPAAFPEVDWAAEWDDGHAFTSPVGRRRANPWGLHDVIGNVWEWCADWHDADYYAASPERDPQGPDEGRMRAVRGGGWYDPVQRTRSAQRAWFSPVFRYCQLSGFRVVCEVQ